MAVSTQQKMARIGRVVSLREPELDDCALVEALKDSEPGAMEIMYDRYVSHVQRVLARVLGVDPVLPELLHDVFVQAFSSVHSIKDGAKLKGWLTSIAVFTARGYIRKRTKTHSLWFGDTATPPELTTRGADHEMREALACTYRILDKLPTDERIAFALRYMEGMELTEVASANRVSLATIKRRIARAKKRFYSKAIESSVLKDWIERGEKWGVG